MDKKGRLPLNHINENVKANYTLSGKELWVNEMLQLSAPKEEFCGLNSTEWAQQSVFEADFNIQKLELGMTYQLSGRAKANVPSLCSHCGASFVAPRKIDLQHSFAAPKRRKSSSEQGLEDWEQEQVDFTQLDEQYIDFIKYFSEVLVLSEPFADAPEHYEGLECIGCAAKVDKSL